MTDQTEFDYNEAFSRNIGWVSLSEQQEIRQKRVAIAGLGGVGGGHFLALTRLGVERFHVADLDQFDLANMNRQAGCGMGALGQEKVHSMVKQALDINPNLYVERFDRGVCEANIDAFLQDVDVVVDGLDLYAPKVRRLLFAKAYEKKIPLVTAGPLGAGTAYLVFDEHSPHPDRYFDFNDTHSDMELLVHFLVGLAPKALQSSYIAAPQHVSPLQGKVCSLSAGSYLATGVLVAKVFQLLLGRGQIRSAPHYQQYDALRNQFVHGRLRWGNRSPWQSLKIRLVMRAFKKMQAQYVPLPHSQAHTIVTAKRA